MTNREKFDYIAIQAMKGLISNDNYILDHASVLRDESTSEDSMTETLKLVEAAYNIADLMVQESDTRAKLAAAAREPEPTT
jgi:hypothetical protein